MEDSRLDETVAMLRCLRRLSKKADQKEKASKWCFANSSQAVGNGIQDNDTKSVDDDNKSRSEETQGRDIRLTGKVQGTGGQGEGTRATGECGWEKGFNAVLEAVQQLVRQRTGGASLALCC